MYLKTDGIVLRETEYKDNDKLLTILTRENGQVTAKARGVKSRTSKLRAGCQLLTFSEFTLLDYQGRYLVTEAVPKEMFPRLREDVELLSLASYFAQVTEAISQEDAPDPEMARRRLGFYARCGLRTAGYDTEMFGVHYKTLYLAGGPVDDVALMEEHRFVYENTFSADKYHKYVRIPFDSKAAPGPKVPWQQ